MHAQRQHAVNTSVDHHRAIHDFIRHGGHIDPTVRYELERAARSATDRLLADPTRFRREVEGNVIRYLPLPHVPAVPRPGEDGEPQAMSETWFWFGVALLTIGALMVTALHKAGLV